VLILTYVIFVLGLVFDLQATVQGFGEKNIVLESKSCFDQNITVGVTEGNYGMQTSSLLSFLI
jgi:hypothetical protein